MLPEQNRLKKKKDFEMVFRHGKPFFTPILAIKAAKNNLNVSRFGIVISKKISKRAVKRNLARRRIREIIRASLQDIATGYDVVILTRPGIMEKDFDELKKTLLFALMKIQLLKRP